jgi:hypothetical protein
VRKIRQLKNLYPLTLLNGSEGWTMEGEKEFLLDIEIPENITLEFYQIFEEDEVEEEEEIRNLFDELLSLKRAACMIEVHAPIEKVHRAEYLLREKGYIVLSSVYFGLDFEDGFKSQEPGHPEPLTSMYISLHPGFIEVARLIEAGICGDALCGLLFGYDTKNIIGYFDQPDPSPEELKEYWNSIPP